MFTRTMASTWMRRGPMPRTLILGRRCVTTPYWYMYAPARFSSAPESSVHCHCGMRDAHGAVVEPPSDTFPPTSCPALALLTLTTWKPLPSSSVTYGKSPSTAENALPTPWSAMPSARSPDAGGIGATAPVPPSAGCVAPAPCTRCNATSTAAEYAPIGTWRATRSARRAPPAATRRTVLVVARPAATHPTAAAKRGLSNAAPAAAEPATHTPPVTVRTLSDTSTSNTPRPSTRRWSVRVATEYRTTRATRARTMM